MSSSAQPSNIPDQNSRVSWASNHPSEPNEAAFRMSAPENFEERNKRTEAAIIIASNERLEWHARARNETVPQTRLYFEKIVAGIDDSQWPVKWEDDYGDSDSDDLRGKKADSGRHGIRAEQAGPSSSSTSGPRDGRRSAGQSGSAFKAKQRA